MSHSPYTDLDRPPLDERALNRALVRPGGLWRRIRVVAETGSTNADLTALAESGEQEGLVLVAEAQTAGRGRLDRAWTAPPRSGLTFSVLLRPRVPVTRLGWLALLAGVAVVRALRNLPEIEGAARGGLGDAALKWPNDVLVGDRKLAGVLAERCGTDALVIGVGLNVGLRAGELPVPTATSLALEGAPTDRAPLLTAILRELAIEYTAFGRDGVDALRQAYKAVSATLGRRVRVELPGGTSLTGEAVDIDEIGRLVVRADDGDHALSAGDVVHVR